MALTAYYTGMRQGEIRNLTRSQLDLDRRVIRLGPEDTKERSHKRVPIHDDLVPVLKRALTVRRKKLRMSFCEKASLYPGLK